MLKSRLTILAFGAPVALLAQAPAQPAQPAAPVSLGQRLRTESPAIDRLVGEFHAREAFQKAEALYLDAVRAFGAHPMTYLNIAKFYYKWHKRDDAFEYAERALAMDPNLAEAIEIRDKTA